LLGGLGAVLRGGWLITPVHLDTWTILGSLFMFRLIVYLYDMHHKAAPFSFVRASGYFFMLPNVCFPLFPLVDYKTFCSSHYNRASLPIYQTGLSWILRGIVQLLLYRLVYQFAMVNPFEVTSLGGVARFMVSTYLLYLHVSGQFHLIIGMLHLFGFSLPETHHRYLLAASFTDFWRRINIYWKDFIMKIFFYPAYFRLKHLGPTTALALATLYAFVATWALHSYQWFWLKGSFLLTFQDMLFWSILAALVLVNAIYEARWGRSRALTRTRPTLRTQVGVALRTVGTFLTICTLWTVWGAQSSDELVMLLSAAQHVTLGEAALVLAGLVGLGLAGVVWGHSTAERTDGIPYPKEVQQGPSFGWSALRVGLASGGLLLLAILPLLVDLDKLPGGELLAGIQMDQLNRMDVEALRRGYYEDLDVPRRQAELEKFRKNTPAGWSDGLAQLYRPTNDFRHEQMVPAARAYLHGQWVTHNRWGMRSPECEKAKSPGVVRIAMLGSSHEYGMGVADKEMYGFVLEDLLNREEKGHSPRYEFLNFAQDNQNTFQALQTLENKVFDFDPDVVFLAINGGVFRQNVEHLAKIVRSGQDIPFDCLRSVIERAGVDERMSEERIQAMLWPYAHEMVRHGFQQLGGECRRRGISVYLPFRPFTFKWYKDQLQYQEEQKRVLQELAKEASLPIVDMSPAYESIKNRTEFMVAPWDDHTNARGHRLLGNQLFRALHDSEGKCLLRPRTTNARVD
jgi:hypothetical protein